MAEQAHAHGDHGDHTSHYVKIWGALLVLFLISVIGPIFEIPALTLITAFGVACVKAFLVMKYFMHLDAELKLVWYILAGSLVLMFVFFFGTAADVRNHEGSRWVNVAAQAEVARGMAAGDGHHGEHGGGHEEGGHATEEGHGAEGEHGGTHEAPNGGH
ncbi:MAG: cytochrome C oxidase subunit IV family protein [Myxococcota bacterium]